MIAIVEICTFLIVAAITVVVTNWLAGQIAVRRRLRGAGAGAPNTGQPQGLFKQSTVDNPFLLWVQNATLQNDPKERDKIRRDLALANMDHPAAPAIFVVVRFSLAVGLPLLFVLFEAASSKPMTGIVTTALPLFLCGVGLMAPGIWLRGRAADRRTAVEHQFPDALDLIVVCVESGLSLEASFMRVGEEMQRSHRRVSELLAGVSGQMAAGRGRADALRIMADQADVDSVRSFVALLIQTDTLGVSIANTLRTFAAEMRATRFHKAEERAMRVPLLMTLPLVTCLLPVIVGVLMLPPMIGVYRRFIT